MLYQHQNEKYKCPPVGKIAANLNQPAEYAANLDEPAAYAEAAEPSAFAEPAREVEEEQGFTEELSICSNNSGSLNECVNSSLHRQQIYSSQLFKQKRKKQCKPTRHNVCQKRREKKMIQMCMIIVWEEIDSIFGIVYAKKKRKTLENSRDDAQHDCAFGL